MNNLHISTSATHVKYTLQNSKVFASKMSELLPDETGACSDEDSISLTSTAPSEPQEEYAVETIMAEKDGDGTTYYLVKWEGYAEDRCTWEPASSFQSDDTLFDWKTKKMRLARGLETPCDVEALLNRIEAWVKSSEERKSRRRAKRIRLGLPVAPLETDDESLFSSGCTSHDEDIPLKDFERTDPKDGQARRARSLVRSEDRCRDWSAQEENALMRGLDIANGPNYDQILSLSGSRVTIDQSLGNRNARDLQIRAQQMYDEFEKHGMSMPLQLKSLGDAPRFDSARRDSSHSTMHMPFEKASIIDRRGSTNEDITRHKSKQSLPAASLKTSLGLSRHESPLDQLSRKIPKTSTREANRPRQLQMGSSGRGPARLPVTNASTSSKRTVVSGADVLKNWSKFVSGNKYAPKPGKYVKVLKRKELAPDINSLILVDPKLAAKKSSLPTLSSTYVPPKTPYELIQHALLDNANESSSIDNHDLNNLEALEEMVANPQTPERNGSDLMKESSAKAPNSSSPELMASATVPDSNARVAVMVPTRPETSEPNLEGMASADECDVNISDLMENGADGPDSNTPEFMAESSAELSAKTPLGVEEERLDSSVREETVHEKRAKVPHHITPGVVETGTIGTASSAHQTPTPGLQRESLLEINPSSRGAPTQSAEFTGQRFRLGGSKSQSHPFSFAPPASPPASPLEAPPVWGKRGRGRSDSANLNVAPTGLSTAQVPRAPKAELYGDLANAGAKRHHAPFGPSYLTKPVTAMISIGNDTQSLGLVRIVGLGENSRMLLTSIQDAPNKLYIRFEEMCGAVNYRAFCHSVSSRRHLPYSARKRSLR